MSSRCFGFASSAVWRCEERWDEKYTLTSPEKKLCLASLQTTERCYEIQANRTLSMQNVLLGGPELSSQEVT
jgi:hypothetical protein